MRKMSIKVIEMDRRSVRVDPTEGSRLSASSSIDFEVVNTTDNFTTLVKREYREPD